jgi:site-specific DNA-methyltransferase (adenine-specific)
MDIDLRLGKWQDVLADVGEVDAIITDPPYLSACKECGGNRGGASQRGWARRCKSTGGTAMEYDPATPELLEGLCLYATDSCSGWFVAFNDFDGVAMMRQRMKAAGWVVAEPIAWVKPPALTPPRGSINLPTKGTEFLCISRKGDAHKGYKPGSYVGPNSATPSCQFVTGGKPLSLMRAIIRDYTKPGDLVCDPFAGGGTTLLAAAMEGRRAIGAEMDPETYAKAKARLAKGYTKPLFVEEPAKPRQGSLL